MPVASTPAFSVQVLDFKDIGLLIQRGRLYALPVRRASALPAASFGFHLTMDTLAVRLTLPPVGCVKDFEEISSSPSSRCALPGAPLKKRGVPNAGHRAFFIMLILGMVFRVDFYVIIRKVARVRDRAVRPEP
jgi:hypothetical protein